ncbi:MAG: patatin-like phospholipase family protein [Chloroflexi bacterium]|nr:patatin-like phospholipase family protein [Chloroflexota bacterium]
MRLCFHRPKVGVALSGGGSRGLAHIGVLKVIEREGIPVHFLAGTSMGGVIAAGYAAGLGTAYLEAEALRMGKLRNLARLIDRSFSNQGLLRGQRIREYFEHQLGGATFADLRIPLALIAVDLIKGEEVILKEGSIADALRATISLPGVFVPFHMNEWLLVDGGVLNNLPADVVRRMGADVVIAVDVSVRLQDYSQLLRKGKHRLLPIAVETLTETLQRTVGIMERQLVAQKLAQARPEVLIEPMLDNDINLLSGFAKVADCIAAGENAAVAALPAIRQVLRSRLDFPRFRAAQRKVQTYSSAVKKVDASISGL